MYFIYASSTPYRSQIYLTRAIPGSLSRTRIGAEGRATTSSLPHEARKLIFGIINMHYLNILGVNTYANRKRRNPAEQGVAVRYHAPRQYKAYENAIRHYCSSLL